ncbi:MAG: 1-acyl-sn-glycerol-3-phosphate acyltransferase [Archangium sp.]
MRRLVTVPGVMLALAIVLTIFPLLVVLALFVDLVRLAKSFSTTRLTVFLLAFLVVENVGLLLLFWTFLSTRAGTRPRHARTFAIQRLYTAAHLASVTRIFSLRFVVEGDSAVPGPLLVFVRHASLVDVLIPGGFLANRHLLELRYVLKKELLVEPCLDIAGHWIPNHFVDRSGLDTDAELAKVRALKTDIGPTEGVVLYPEGTRFSRGKRKAIIEKLPAGSAERAHAESLRHLLPIRKGGALALLEAAPSCDVLFVGHHGLEGLTRLGDIWRGTLVGKTVTVRFWREPANSVPSSEEQRITWVRERWMRVDDWLESLDE